MSKEFNNIAEKSCCFGPVSDGEFDKLTELAEIKIDELQRVNRGAWTIQ